MTAIDRDKGGAAAPRQPAQPRGFGPVRCGPSFDRDKLCWHEYVLADAELGAMPKVVAGVIMHDLNAQRGYAWRSQASIAATIGCTERTVQSAISELRRLGYIEVNQGAGGSNHYAALIPSPGTPNVAKEISGGMTSGANPASSPAVAEAMAASPTDEAGFRQDFLDKPLEQAHAQPADPSNSSAEAVDEEAYDREALPERWSAAAIRDLAFQLVGPDWVYSYLEQSFLDGERGEIIPSTEIAAKRIAERLGKELPGTGWTIGPVRSRLDRGERPIAPKRKTQARRAWRG